MAWALFGRGVSWNGLPTGSLLSHLSALGLSSLRQLIYASEQILRDVVTLHSWVGQRRPGLIGATLVVTRSSDASVDAVALLEDYDIRAG